MALSINIGISPEFMATYKGKDVYPLITRANELTTGKNAIAKVTK